MVVTPTLTVLQGVTTVMTKRDCNCPATHIFSLSWQMITVFTTRPSRGHGSIPRQSTSFGPKALHSSNTTYRYRRGGEEQGECVSDIHVCLRSNVWCSFKPGTTSMSLTFASPTRCGAVAWHATLCTHSCLLLESMLAHPAGYPHGAVSASQRISDPLLRWHGHVSQHERDSFVGAHMK